MYTLFALKAQLLSLQKLHKGNLVVVLAMLILLYENSISNGCSKQCFVYVLKS